jgi:hypothetical protein
MWRLSFRFSDGECEPCLRGDFANCLNPGKLGTRRCKGELERDAREIGFRSLTILRPGIIDGERPSFRNDSDSLV